MQRADAGEAQLRFNGSTPLSCVLFEHSRGEGQSFIPSTWKIIISVSLAAEMAIPHFIMVAGINYKRII